MMNFTPPHGCCCKYVTLGAPSALQTYLAGLSVGPASVYFMENARVGRIRKLFHTEAHSLMFVCMSHRTQRRDRGVQGRLVGIGKNMSRVFATERAAAKFRRL